jgi:hypothetical protein
MTTTDATAQEPLPDTIHLPSLARWPLVIAS